MATVKISELDELVDYTQVSAGDLLHIINKEEYSQNYPTGTNKRIKAITLANGLARISSHIPQAIQTALDSKVPIENFNNANLKIAPPVKAATVSGGNIANLSATLAGVYIDGVLLAVNDRVLIKDQTDKKLNGIYIVNSGAPTRASDFDSAVTINGGYVLVNGGDTQKGSGWSVTSTIVVVGVDPIVFTQFTSAVTNITKATIGLSRVQNTNDAEKDISTKTATALAGKQATITGAATTVTSNDLALNRVLISNASGKIAVSDITTTELSYLDGVTSSIQTQLNGKLSTATGVTSTQVAYLNGVTSSIQTQLNSKQAAVTGVTSTEIGYLDGVTGAIQTQLNSKQALITGSASSITSNNLTVSRAVITDSSGKIAVSSASSTEIGYLDGVTSAIQTQLNGKQATITGAATAIVSNNLTAGRVVITDSSGKIAVSSITATELSYLDNVSSAIQTQLNTKAPTNNPEFTGTVKLPATTTIGGTAIGINAADIIPAGAVMAFAMQTAPDGWLECNGGTKSRTTYARLFAAIGTLYGAGNGETNFNLPDLNGRFIRGYGESDGSAAFGAKQADALQNITGKINLNANAGLSATLSGAFYSSEGNTSTQVRFGDGGVAGDYTFDASRVARTSTETRPKNIAMLYCIKI